MPAMKVLLESKADATEKGKAVKNDTPPKLALPVGNQLTLKYTCCSLG